MPTAHPLTPFGKPPRNQNKLFWSDATLLGCPTGDRGKLGESIATFCCPTESWSWGVEKENNLSRKADPAGLILKKWQHACLNQTRLYTCNMKEAALTLCRQKFKYVTYKDWVSTSQKTQSLLKGHLVTVVHKNNCLLYESHEIHINKMCWQHAQLLVRNLTV